MSNKTSDKNVVTEEDLEVLNEVLLHNRETEQVRIAIEHILAEREQKDKRIQELEEENKHLSNVSDYETISLECVHLEEQLEIANSRIQELEKEKVELKEYNKIVSDRIVEYKKNSISKRVIIEGLEKIEDYFDRLNGPDEDIEYIRQVKKELLEGEK